MPTVGAGMEVVVVGKRVEVPAALRAASVEKAERLGRFADDIRRIEVDFSQTRNRRVGDTECCEILVHLKGHLAKGHASSGDPKAALDLALEKVEHQLRRLHERRVSRRDSRRDGGPGHAARDGNGGPAGAVEGDGLGELGDLDPASSDDDALIVKTKQFAVKPMDPEEAALQMGLLGHDFFLFTSSETGRAAVVYRRRDGHFGLIEALG